ncbi:MAG: autotransporter outer membrane beta-barrel domain-containing protein, partial [Caulobacteraceae bacterium]
MTRSTSSNGQATVQQSLPGAGRRAGLYGQSSRHAMLSALGAVAMASAGLMAPGLAMAADVVTTDTTAPTNPPNDRHVTTNSAAPVAAIVAAGDTVSGNGLALTNTGAGGVLVINDGTITVDAGQAPTAGGTAALNLTGSGGSILYAGDGDVINSGVGNGLQVSQGGAGAVTVQATGAIVATTGEGVVVRDVAASTGLSVTTGAVTALTGGQDGIDVQSFSTTGNVVVVANGDLAAGNAGVVAAIFPAGGVGDISVTTNGAI